MIYGKDIVAVGNVELEAFVWNSLIAAGIRVPRHPRERQKSGKQFGRRKMRTGGARFRVDKKFQLPHKKGLLNRGGACPSRSRVASHFLT